MLLFDLPDYSKSSVARREKLARGGDRPRERRAGGGSTGVSPLSRILPPSPRASRRFGACVMCKSDETQSGQLLIWQLRGVVGVIGGGERGREILLINDVSVYSAHILDPFNLTCIWKHIKCCCEIKAGVNKTTPSSLSALIYDMGA